MVVEGDAARPRARWPSASAATAGRARPLRHRDRVGAERLTVDIAADAHARRYPTPGRAAGGRSPRRSPTTCAAATSRSTRWRSRCAATSSATCTTRYGGRRDLDDRRDPRAARASFLDDPTRLLRAVRYETRLGFQHGPRHRGAGARGDRDRGDEARVSGTRLRDELLDLLLAEHDAPSALERLHDLGSTARSTRRSSSTRRWPRSAAIGAGEVGADRVLAVLAALIVAATPTRWTPWLERLGLERDQRERVRARRARRARAGRGAAAPCELSPSAIHTLLRDEPPEALALALALGVSPEPMLESVDAAAVRAAGHHGRRPDRRGRRARAGARPRAGRDAAGQARRRGRRARRRAALRAAGGA